MDDTQVDNIVSREFAPSIFPQPTLSGEISLDSIGDFFASLLRVFRLETILLVVKVLLALAIVVIVVIGVYYWLLLQEERKARYEWLKKYIGHPDDNYQRRPKSRWDHVKTLFESPNEADWRMAVIEADTMLDDLLIRLGYEGNSTGERLRATAEIEFPKKSVAWKAHIVRNKIAHEGSQFRLSHLQALRVMRWYEEVFRHARYIS